MNIVIEGFDGCGKTTVAAAVAKHIGGKVVAFPARDAYTGPAIDAYLKGQWNINVGTRHTDGDSDEAHRRGCHLDALALQSLMVANRMELMPVLFATAMTQMSHTVLARYWQSGWVYGQLDGLDRVFLERAHACMAPAACHILLDCSASTLRDRRRSRDGVAAPERYETKRTVTERGVELYRELWGLEPTLGSPLPSVWHVVDAERPLEGVLKEVLDVLGA